MTDQANLSLTDDQQAVAKREISSLLFAVSQLLEPLKKGTPLSRDLATTVLKVSEHYLADIGKALGVTTQTEADIVERHANLRKANLRVHELEAMLGKSQSPEHTLMGLKSLSEQLNRWWDLEGFGHISEMHFGPHGCEAKFSCHLFGNFRTVSSDTPVSDKSRRAKWHESLIERGFELGEEERDRYIRDCDHNREVLAALFAQRFPTGDISKFENRRAYKGGFILVDVTVFIRDLAEIAALPVPPEAEAAPAATA